jgi:hypothetical protein
MAFFPTGDLRSPFRSIEEVGTILTVDMMAIFKGDWPTVFASLALCVHVTDAELIGRKKGDRLSIPKNKVILLIY